MQRAVRGSLHGRILQRPGSMPVLPLPGASLCNISIDPFYYAAFTGDPDVHIPMDVGLNPELTPST